MSDIGAEPSFVAAVDGAATSEIAGPAPVWAMAIIGIGILSTAVWTGALGWSLIKAILYLF
jgi:hypothetical protein